MDRTDLTEPSSPLLGPAEAGASGAGDEAGERLLRALRTAYVAAR